MASPRIVVGFDSASDALLAELAVRLAQALEADLTAVFVAGLEALHLGALPFAALIEHSGQLHRLDRERVHALFRVAATRTERELRHAAARARVAASFRVKRGRFLGVVVSEASERDLVVVGSARHGPWRTRAHGVVAVTARPGVDLARLLEVAAAVAVNHEPLVALVTDRAEREVVMRWAEERGRRVLVKTVTSSEPEVLAKKLAPLGLRMLIVGNGAWLKERRADELRRRLDCPLIIVR